MRDTFEMVSAAVIRRLTAASALSTTPVQLPPTAVGSTRQTWAGSANGHLDTIATATDLEGLGDVRIEPTWPLDPSGPSSPFRQTTNASALLDEYLLDPFSTMSSFDDFLHDLNGSTAGAGNQMGA
jgi:hypothetical protein